MNKKIKIISLLLFILISLSCFTLPTMAEEPEQESYEWEYDYENEILKNSDREFKYYELPLGYGIYSKDTVYFYENSYSSYYTLRSYKRDGEIVWESEDPTFFATETGLGYVEELVSGNYTGFALYYDYSSCDVDEAFVSELDRISIVGRKTELDVTQLSSASEHQIRAYDESGCVYYVYGAIYDYAGDYYYVNYDLLPNNYFDADGNFSYRRGEVSAVKLTGAHLDAFNEVYERLDDRVYMYEEEETEKEPLISDKTRALIRLGVVLVGWGYCLPILVGVIAFRRAKRTIPEHKRYWYITLAASCLWLIISAVITLLLIFG